MIKIKLFEPEIHRNETTFRPYVNAASALREIGLDIHQNHNSYDILLVAQASIVDKKKSLVQSSEDGANVCDKIGGNYIVIDGQDSHSLMGIVEILRLANRKPMLVLKNSLLNDLEMYKTPYACGRFYWGYGNYSIPDIDTYKDMITLSGTNWLSTVNINLDNRSELLKDTDVSALFSNGVIAENTEHLTHHSKYYNEHRKKCISVLSGVGGITVDVLDSGSRVSEREYFYRMSKCKTMIAPFGYGEIAPRDIQSAAMNAVLIKPDMGHIKTIPNIYIPFQTYIPCKHDFSDLEESIQIALGENAQFYINSMINMFQTEYTSEKLAVYLHSVFIDKLKHSVTHE